MNYKVVQWAMDDAPMTLTEKGKPDATARHVLQVLAETAHEDGSQSFQGIPTIEYRTGLDRRTIQRAFRRLETAGLISQTGLRYGVKVWQLAIWLKRPASDREQIDAATERSREAAAERKRRSRAKTVTHSECVTDPPEDAGRHALKVRDVTHSTPGRHALNAAVSTMDPGKIQTPPIPAGCSPSDPQREAAAPSSLRSEGLPSKAGDDHVPAEDPLPVVRTATIPARARGVAGFDETELADWFERAVLGLVSREEVELVTGELDRLKRHHMQECGRCQQRTTPCPAGAPLVGFWAQLSVMPNLGAPAPF